MQQVHGIARRSASSIERRGQTVLLTSVELREVQDRGDFLEEGGGKDDL